VLHAYSVQMLCVLLTTVTLVMHEQTDVSLLNKCRLKSSDGVRNVFLSALAYLLLTVVYLLFFPFRYRKIWR